MRENQSMTILPRRLALLVLLLAVPAVVLALACSDDGDATPTTAPTGEPTASSTASPTGEPTATPAHTATADPEAIVFTWTREGGIAGFCDGLALTAGHQATIGTCEDPAPSISDPVFMPNDAIREFEAWRDQLASFEVEWADEDAVADGMTIRVTFVGRGSATADEDTRREIAEFAAVLYRELREAQPSA
jgi:hypothetical protein